jgi:hypothetical protein
MSEKCPYLMEDRKQSEWEGISPVTHFLQFPEMPKIALPAGEQAHISYPNHNRCHDLSPINLFSKSFFMGQR